MFQYDENLTLGDAFGLNPDSYSELDVSDLPVSIRVTNRLLQKNIKTVADLLKVTTAFLMGINGFGHNCIEQVYSYLETLEEPDSATVKKPTTERETKPLLTRFKDMIAVGDFSFMKEDVLSSEEVAALEKYKAAYEVLGEDLVLDCVCSPEKIMPIMTSFYDFYRRNERTHQLEQVLKGIPLMRQHCCCKYFIEAFTYDETSRRKIRSFYSSENAELSSIVNSIDADDPSCILLAERFLKWCAYDLEAQINELFEKLYSNERIKQVVEARSQKKTLNDVGNQLGVTRERARQIELKAVRSFSRFQSQIRIMGKLYAEQNGQGIITQEDIEEISGRNAAALIFLLRQTESTFYSYDTTLDAFVVGDSDLATRIQDYVDTLPDVIHKRDLQNILESAKQEEDLDPAYLEKAIAEAYRLTGDVYHKARLSLKSIYEGTLQTYYPGGIHVYDDDEIATLRNRITEEYGDIALPENNRAIAARIASIGTLAGRGIYIAKRKKWISKELEHKLIDFIESNDSPVLLIGMIFTEFEDELQAEGIDNRYFLQGVLRELYGDRLYFRRDYVSRDKDFTSIYSSIIAFIKQHQYPVKKEEIQEKFKGITEIVIALATSDSDILNYFGEYLHGSRLIIHEDERLYLLNYLNTCLSDNTAHHIKDIYSALTESKPEIFSRNAATAPYCVFSVLEYLFRDRFQFSRPYVAKNGVEIGRPIERLQEMIYGEDEFMLNDISIFARDNHIQLYSILDFINSLNDRFLMKNSDAIISIEKAGLNEDTARQIERFIGEEVVETTPIRNLLCISKFPAINCDWSEWLIYSILYKWSNSLDVALSSSQLRQSIPLVAPRGKMDTTAFKDVSVTPVKIKIDNLDNIDDLISDLITEDMLEDI